VKTTTTAMDTALARTDGQGFRWLLEITPPGGSTLYLCADAQTIGANTYAAELLSLGDINERIGAIPDVQVSILDSAANRTAAVLSADARLLLWAVGTAITDAMLMLWGEVADPFSRAAGRISFDIVARAMRQDQPVTQLLSPAVFPGADPDAVGRTMPVIYGVLAGAPCLSIDAGSITTLQLDLNASANSMSVSDVSAFPVSGTIQVDVEQMTYTGKTATTLTGLTRGANGTVAVAHDKGATVAEIQTQYDYLVADHPVKSIDAVYVDGVRQQGADFTVLPNDGGQAKVRFNTLPTIVRQVNLVAQDGITVVDGSGVLDGIEVIDGIIVVDGINVSDNINVSASQPLFARKQLVSTSAVPQYGDSANPAYLYFPAPGVNVNHWDINLGQLAVSTTILPGGWVKLFCHNKLILHQTSGSIVVNLLATVIEFTGAMPSPVPLTMQISSGSTASISITINPPPAANVYYIDPIVTTKTGAATKSGAASKSGTASKAGTVSKTGSVIKTGTVTLTGNSVADTKIGGIVTVDVQGYADDASGSITGTPNALIVQPDHVCRHLITTYGNATAAEAAASDFDAFAGESMACYIDQPASLRELLARIGEQTRAIIHYAGDRWIMRKRPASGAPAAATLTDLDIIMQDSGASTLSESRSGLRSLVNQYRWRAGLRPDRAAWDGSDSLDDAASQASYGLRSRTISMQYVSKTQALIALNWLLARTANPNRAMVDAAVCLYMARLEPGDIISINSTKTGVSITGEVGSMRRATSGPRNGSINLSLEEL